MRCSPYAFNRRIRPNATTIDMDEKDRLVVLLDMMNCGTKATSKSKCAMLT